MKFADLFCGVGGSTFGALEAGLEPHLLVDNDIGCGAELPPKLRRFFHPTDLSLPSEDFFNKLEAAEVLLCSPPCQAFSTLSSRNRPPVARITDMAFAKTICNAASHTRRKLIIIENVPSFLGTEMARHIREELTGQGYYINSEVRDAADFGVPQRRKRGIIIASASPFIIDRRFPRSYVKDAFSNLPKINSADPLHLTTRKHSALVLQRIRAIPKNGGSRHALPENLQLACHKRSSGYNDVYGRMSWDAQSPTITSGCTNPSKGRFLHPQEDRAITLREAARIQTLPDELFLPQTVSVEARARMIGNAFPSRFVRNLIETIL